MIKAIFFDLSGVLYEGRHVIDGAVQAIRRAQDSDLAIRFVTNTSRMTRQAILVELARLGFSIQQDQLFTAPVTAMEWVRQHGRRPYCLVHRDIQSEFADLDQTDPNAVIIGDAADDLNYANLNRAFQLCQQGASLLGIGRNRYFKLQGELQLDAGPFIAAIEYAANTEAIIMGKPSADFFAQVVASSGCRPQEVVMVGDDVYGDVEGALLCGLQACLVQTGKYQAGDEDRIEQHFPVYPSVVEAVDAVLQKVPYH